MLKTQEGLYIKIINQVKSRFYTESEQTLQLVFRPQGGHLESKTLDI